MRILNVALALIVGGVPAAVRAQGKPDDTLNAVVGVTAKIQANAPSAETPGLERGGTTLAEFYRKVWRLGAAGTAVRLKLLQGARVTDVTVRSIDRLEYSRPSKTY